jgi:hypothetical protein
MRSQWCLTLAVFIHGSKIRRMDDPEKKSGGSGAVILSGLMLLFLPMVYVLGIGPAAVVARSNPSAAQFLEVVYLPLGWIAKHCGPIDSAMNWYMELWTG